MAVHKKIVHTTYIKTDDGGDAVICKVHEYDTDKPGTYVPKLDVIRNPEIEYYITKPQYRVHKYKKEWEDISKLQRYRCKHVNLQRELYKQINDTKWTPKRLPSLKKLCNSPYIYGADLNIETRVRNFYQTKFEESKLKDLGNTTGYFDMEWDITVDNGPIIMATFTHMNKAYLALNENYFWIKQKDGNRRRGTLAELEAYVTKNIKVVVDEFADKCDADPKSKAYAERLRNNSFKYEFFIGSERDILIWSLKNIHENKTDFMGIWNIDSDIPKIIKRLLTLGIDPADAFTTPELDKIFKYYKYRKDTGDKPTNGKSKKKGKKAVQERWHWFTTPSHTQWLDSMCLFARIRVVEGMRDSYALDAILNAELGIGKLYVGDRKSKELQGADWHRYMSKNCILDYCTYGIFDVISLQLLDWQNDDFGTMVSLNGATPYHSFPHQTVKVSNSLAFYCKKQDKILATVGENMDTPLNAFVYNIGGSVLPSERVDGIGIRFLSDRPNFYPTFYCFISDIDFTAMYPSVQMCANISKETKLFTVLGIEGRNYTDSLNYFSYLLSTKENAVTICKNYHQLPNYTEMDALFTEYCKDHNIDLTI